MRREGVNPPGGLRGWRSRAAVGLLVAGSLLLTLGVGEALVRAFDLGPQFEVVYLENFELSDDPVLGYTLRPGSPDGPYAINSAGFRDREFPLRKPEGVFRIAAIGDSITYGHGFSQLEAWPKQLESLLDAAGAPDYEVLNFGVAGYNIAQIVERLRGLALAYQPDLVIYGYALNDPQSYSFEGLLLERLRDEREEYLRSLPGGRLGPLLSRSRLYLMARQLLLQPERGDTTEFEMQLDPGFVADARGRRDRYFRGLHQRAEPRARLERGMAELAALAEERDVPVVVAIFPLFVEGEADPPVPGVHEAVARLARAHGLHAIDLGPAFRAAREELAMELNADLMHPNPVGHRVAALALLRGLAEAGLTRVDPDAAAARDPLDASIAAALARDR